MPHQFLRKHRSCCWGCGSQKKFVIAAAAAAASEPCWNPPYVQETVWLLSGHYYFTQISSQTIVSDYSLLEAHSLFRPQVLLFFNLIQITTTQHARGLNRQLNGLNEKMEVGGGCVICLRVLPPKSITNTRWFFQSLTNQLLHALSLHVYVRLHFMPQFTCVFVLGLCAGKNVEPQ